MSRRPMITRSEVDEFMGRDPSGLTDDGRLLHSLIGTFQGRTPTEYRCFVCDSLLQGTARVYCDKHRPWPLRPRSPRPEPLPVPSGKLFCRFCGRALVAHSLTERCYR